MRPMDAYDVDSLPGSRSGDRVVAEAWYDGALVAGDLPVVSWRLDWDRSRQVQCQGQVQIVDADGVLDPWAVDDPLNVGGATVRLTWVFASGGEVALGEYRTTQSSPAQQYVMKRIVTGYDDQGLPIYEDEGRWLRAGVQVTLNIDDLTWNVKTADFLGPETVQHTSSVLAEVDRLCEDLIDIDPREDVQDASVPSAITYEGDRMDAIGSLLRSIDAEGRMTGDGVMEIIPSAEGDPVWVAAGGEEGVLIDFGRTYSAGDLVNTVVVEGRREDDDRPLIGVARETTGPLRTDGPHGLVPAYRQADLLNTPVKVDRADETHLREVAAARSIVLPVTCLPHPGLQVSDVVRVVTPEGDLVGPVQSMSLSGSDGAVHPMSIGVSVPMEAVQNIGVALRGSTA